MDDIPIHDCTYGDTPVVAPTSQLNCDQRRGKALAEQAELAADMYGLDYIDKRIEQYATLSVGQPNKGDPMSTAADYPILSVKRSPAGDCLAIRNAERNEEAAWVLFSEEGELTESVEHDYVANWIDMTAISPRPFG